LTKHSPAINDRRVVYYIGSIFYAPYQLSLRSLYLQGLHAPLLAIVLVIMQAPQNTTIMEEAAEKRMKNLHRMFPKRMVVKDNQLAISYALDDSTKARVENMDITADTVEIFYDEECRKHPELFEGVETKLTAKVIAIMIAYSISSPDRLEKRDYHKYLNAMVEQMLDAIFFSERAKYLNSQSLCTILVEAVTEYGRVCAMVHSLSDLKNPLLMISLTPDIAPVDIWEVQKRRYQRITTDHFEQIKSLAHRRLYGNNASV